MFAGSATETADILAVMDADEDANVEFMAGEFAAALKRNAAATGSLSAKNDGCLLSGSATLILPGMYSHSNLYVPAFLPGVEYFLVCKEYIWTVISDHFEVLTI